MTLDNNNLYNEKFYPDRQETELQEFTTCSNPKCKKSLYLGDYAIDWNGTICCDDKLCILGMIDAREVILEDAEE